MDQKVKTERKILRIDGKLRELVLVLDSKGKVVHKALTPIMLEFYPRDALQVMLGSAILAIPVGFTEEVWNLGSSLPNLNVLLIGILSVAFISCFVYYNYYRSSSIREHLGEFLKRVTTTYLLSFLVVGVLLTLIQVAPWQTDTLLALKRTVIVTFPSSLSAAIADMVK